MLKLYNELSYGQKKKVCIEIAKKTKRNYKSIRNWFVSHKKVPEKFEEITLHFLQIETLKMNIKFCESPELIFEMNRKYRELIDKNIEDYEMQ
jgi:hypothetical protein